MTNWRDNLREASFKGVKFLVESHQLTAGRRVVTHEFPGKEDPYTEDLGKAAIKYTITAYVVGSLNSNYMEQRDALIKVLNEYGPGELIHPYLGSLKVQCENGFTVSESKDQGGIATFSIPFVEAGKVSSLGAKSSPNSKIKKTFDKAVNNAEKNFTDNFSLKNQPDYLLSSAFNNLSNLAKLYADLGINNCISDLPDILDLIKNFKKYAADKWAKVLTQLNDVFVKNFEEPYKKLKNIDGTYINTIKGKGRPLSKNVVLSLKKVFNYNFKKLISKHNTSANKQEKKNNIAINSYARQLAILQAARLSPFVNWSTLQEANKAKDYITDALDNELEIITDDNLYESLSDMRVLVTMCLPPVDNQLPNITDFTTTMTVPSLYLSYKLYENIDKADEIIEINSLRRPGFINGGKKLEILTYAR